MPYFTKDYIDFFKELSNNNNRDWFQTNKKRYEKSVKDPFNNFVSALLEELQKDWGPIPWTAKDFVMRIYRDTRFSKDKTPYKDYMAAMVSQYGRKEMTRPGIYLHANHNGVELYTGCYVLEKENLYNVRSKIIENAKQFNALINDSKFKQTYGEVLGDKHKRLPKEFQEAAEKQPLIYNKGFYYCSKLPAKELLSDHLVNKIIANYKVAEDINQFLDSALG